MATGTPLRHPNRANQTAQFYPHSAQFKSTGASGKQDAVVLTSPCAYQARGAGEAGEFEVEASAADQILLPAWHKEVVPKLLCVLTLSDGTVLRFNVLDKTPQGAGPAQTLVLVTPKN